MRGRSIYVSLLVLALGGGLGSARAVAEDGATSAAEHASGDWFGIRPALVGRGIELMLTVQADPSANVAGGLRRGAAVRWPFQAALDVDTERLLGWRGGRFHAGAQTLDGRNASETLVGDVQGFDNVDALRFRQVSEAWLEQRLLAGRLRFKVGKADANADFARVEPAGGFLNSSAGFSPTIQGFPTYPDPAMSVSLGVEPTQWLSLAAGVYDGATNEGCHGRTGNRGPGTFLGAPDALFLIGEAGLGFALAKRPGRVAAGSWRHTGTFERFDGVVRRGTAGWYGVLEQRLFRQPGDYGRALDLFAQVGGADAGLAEVERHVALGLAATGGLPGRTGDAMGLLVTSVRMSASCPTAAGARRETAIELYYGARLRPWLEVKPDLQYVVDPGAHGGSNALAGTVRVTVSF